jgi:hypothetical protein
MDFLIVLKTFPTAPVLSFISSSSRPYCDTIKPGYFKFLTCSSFVSSIFILCHPVSLLSLNEKCGKTKFAMMIFGFCNRYISKENDNFSVENYLN